MAAENPQNPFEDPDFVFPATVQTVQQADGERKLLTFPDGFRCYTHSDEGEAALIYNEVFLKQEYMGTTDATGAGVSSVSLENCHCVFDVGANIGLFTLFAKRQNPDLVVHAFEPIKATYDTLVKNIELHGLTGVRPHQCAVGQEDGGEQSITFFPHLAGNSTRYPESKEDLKRMLTRILGAEKASYMFGSPQVHTVTTRTLSSVIEQEGITAIDLLKIDTEGDELAVLQGIREEHYPIIGQIVAEMHGSAWLSETQSLLESKGYRVFFDAGITGELNTNLYAVR